MKSFSFIFLFICLCEVSGVDINDDLRYVSGEFPSGFKWGAASSAYQIEGGYREDGKGESIWDTYVQQPGNIKDGKTGDTACDSYHKYKKDVQLLHKMGANVYKFSISWSRIMPTGASPTNDKGIAYYKDLISELKANNITPMVTLYHNDLPEQLQRHGGWLNEATVASFVEYARTCFREFGNDVKHWITINDPRKEATEGYGNGTIAPGLWGPGTNTYIVGHNLIKAHTAAYHVYKNEFNNTQGGEVGITLSTHTYEAIYPDIQLHVDAQNRATEFHLGWFAQPIFGNGDYPATMKQLISDKTHAYKPDSLSRLPSFTTEQIQKNKGAADFLDVNYDRFQHVASMVRYCYPPSYTCDSDTEIGTAIRNYPYSGSIFISLLRDTAKWINEQYSVPGLYITQARYFTKSGTDRDHSRRRSIKKNIIQTLEAVKLDNITVKGYMYGSLMDGFEDIDGYTLKSGLHNVYFENEQTRTPRDSADYLSRVSKNNALLKGYPGPVGSESGVVPYLGKDAIYYGQFPDDFKWGVGSAAYTINPLPSGRNRNIHTDTSANDSDQYYEQDVQLIKRLGLKQYRFSIAWSRIFPNGTNASFSETGMEYYRNLTIELINNQIEPVVTLYHWDMPEALEVQGSWLTEATVDRFIEYADICFKRLGDKVKHWVTFYDPLSISTDGKWNTDDNVYVVAKRLILTHARTYRHYSQNYKTSQLGNVGIFLKFSWAEPESATDRSDIDAAERYIQMTSGWFAHPIYVDGDYPEEMKSALRVSSIIRNRTVLPNITTDERNIIKGSSDFLGMIYDTEVSVQNKYVFDTDEVYIKDRRLLARTSTRNFESGIRKMLSRVKYVYDNPSVYVTDISQSGAKISGDMESKIDYYRIYTNNILKAVNLDECNIKGFSVGSLLDGPTGLKDNYHSYGLYEVDFNHPERKRTARGTAHWFSLLATENAFTPGYSKPGGWGIAPKNVDQFHIDKFPEEFMFGAATSAAQVEGGWNVDGKGASIWDTFANADKVKDKSTPQIACDSYHNYKQDIVLLKQLGVKFYRFSIAWPRIMPDGITRNDKGIEYYHNLIDELKMNQIIPLVTIYHWDLPQSLENYGGWLNSSIVDRFRNYAHLLFEEYGGKVDWWITLNEPWVFVVKGYGNGEFAPGISDEPGRKPYIAAHNAIKAHAEAYHDYHDNYKGKGKIGITLNIDWQEPKDPYNPDDIEASEWAIQTFLGWFAHPVYINGDYPDVMKTRIATISTEQGLGGSRLPEFTAAEKARINGTSDFFGINSYSTNLAYKDDPSRAGKEAPDYFKDRGILSDFDPSWPGSGSTWLKVVPWGLRKILNWVKNNYGDREILITENGVSDNTGTLQDSQRAAFIRNYINGVLKAVKYDGINVIGYTAWSLMDNFEWQSGYTERFGLYHVDFEDANRTRTPKSSAQEFHKIIVDHGFTTESKAEPYHPSPLPYQDTFYYKQQFPKDFSWGVTSQYFQGGFGWDTTVNGTSLDVLINGVDLKPDTDTSGLYRVVFNRLNNVDEGRKHVEATHVYTSILWPVMFPNRTIQDVDKTTLIAMRSFLKELPVGNTTITIFTWDLPNIMDTKNNGGWLNESNIDIFVEIARIYFDALGDTVKQWVTFNEPQQYAYLMYESGQLPPYHGNRTNDMYKAMHNMIKAHARVYHMYQKDFKRRQQGKVGLIVRNDWYIPKDSNNPADNDAVLRNLEFEYFWFSDPIFRTGDYPDEMKQHVGGTRLPSFTPREKQLNLGACDFMGINHYGSHIVKTRQPGDAPNGFNEDKDVTTDNNRYNELVIDPTGIRKMLNVIKGRYGKIPIYIAGNGITDTQKTHSNIDRATYIKQYSNEVLKAILHDQVNVKGYSYSRVLDGYSWTSPLNKESGLFYKPSAFTRPREGMQAFKDLITFNGYVDPPKETTTTMRSTTPNKNNNNNNNNNPDKPVNNATRYISNVYFHLLITVFVISKLIA